MGQGDPRMEIGVERNGDRLVGEAPSKMSASSAEDSPTSKA